MDLKGPHLELVVKGVVCLYLHVTILDYMVLTKNLRMYLSWNSHIFDGVEC